MTNRPWLPPTLTEDDIDLALAAPQPHMRMLAAAAVLIEDKHDNAIVFGLRDLHLMYHIQLDQVERDIDRGLKAVWN